VSSAPEKLPKKENKTFNNVEEEVTAARPNFFAVTSGEPSLQN